MKDLLTVRHLLRIIINPGWAPLGVVAVHLVLAEFGLTHRFDHLLHFLGGASIAYFMRGVMRMLLHATSIPKWLNYLLVFTTACTVALFWEFAEFASDIFWGTAVQQGVSETMLDLLFGVLGAAATLCLWWRCGIGCFREAFLCSFRSFRVGFLEGRRKFDDDDPHVG